MVDMRPSCMNFRGVAHGQSLRLAAHPVMSAPVTHDPTAASAGGMSLNRLEENRVVS
jgi:hypothetical protein